MRNRNVLLTFIVLIGLMAVALGTAHAAVLPATSIPARAWYETTNGEGVAYVLDGPWVNTWRDQSGNNFHLDHVEIVGEIDSRPSLVTGVAELASDITLSFDGVDDFLRVEQGVMTQPANTIFAVSQIPDVSPTSIGAWLDSGPDNSPDRRYMIAWGPQDNSNTNIIFATDGVPETRIFHPTPAAGEYVQITGVLNGANSSVSIDGGAPVVGPTLVPPGPTDSLWVGSRVDSPTTGFQPFLGDYAELIIYDGALSAGEIAEVEGYMATKYSTVIPEPGTLLMLVIGAVGLLLTRRRR